MEAIYTIITLWKEEEDFWGVVQHWYTELVVARETRKERITYRQNFAENENYSGSQHRLKSQLIFLKVASLQNINHKIYLVNCMHFERIDYNS